MRAAFIRYHQQLGSGAQDVLFGALKAQAERIERGILVQAFDPVAQPAACLGFAVDLDPKRQLGRNAAHTPSARIIAGDLDAPVSKWLFVDDGANLAQTHEGGFDAGLASG